MSDANCNPVNVAKAVVEAFGGLTPMAKAMGGCPVTTIHAWVKKGRIPAWRERDIAEAAKRSNVALPDGFRREAADAA